MIQMLHQRAAHQSRRDVTDRPNDGCQRLAPRQARTAPAL
jgi:hypothetical protein